MKMARLWFVCSIYYVIFILFTLNVEIRGSEDIYLYETDINPHRTDDSHLSLELLNFHNLHKRQIENSSLPPGRSIADNRSNQQLLDVASTVPTVRDPKTPNISNKQPPLEPNSNSTSNQQLNKNLGENGAGIRKDYPIKNATSTPVQPLQPQQLNDDLIIATNNQTDEDVDDISISKFSDTTSSLNFNKTLEEHNITEVKTDAHIYYNSTFIIDPVATNHYWIDLENNRSDVKINGLLSQSHRRAATVKLSFDFPFYGHIVRNVTIATGGFIYTGDYLHSWLAATQYIAPLMANFDTSLSNDSFIKYVDNGTAFTVQWDRVALQDKPNEGEFTFQATLFDTGDIVFVYKTVPLIIENIQDDQHPVKVGLSDAYIIDRTIFFVRRKTIYEYHRVNFNKEDIKNSTVIYLKSLPTCLDSKDCHTCLTRKIANFQCTWCPAINRCSNGLDRHRQDWLMKGCDRKQLTNESDCSQSHVPDDSHDRHEFYYGSNKNLDPTSLDHPLHEPTQVNRTIEEPINRTLNDPSQTLNERTRHADNTFEDKQTDTLSNTIQASRISPDTRDREDGVRMGASGIIVILLMVALAAGSGIWGFYAYRNPHTTSGQILIRYRPSQWRWKRGEARYTAATIHM